MKIHTYVLLLLLTLAVFPLQAGTDNTSQLPAKYIELAMQNNLALKQQELSLEKSFHALKEARGMFLPSLSIEARYSRAGGGRTIDMPIGDLVNPIHLTLNQLLTANGLEPSFPANIPNESIPFLRKTEQETKLRLIQPLFQPGIYFNFKIKKDMTVIEKAKVNAFKRHLIEVIKTAYFNYLKTLQIKKLLKDTEALLQENLELNESLYRNDKKTEEVVLRSKAELSKLHQQQAEAEKSVRLASSYFNFLLNRPFNAAIDIPANCNKPVFNPYELSELTNRALEHRNEFRQIEGAIAAARHQVGLHRSSILPDVSAVVDYGFQGEKYNFSGENDYWMGSLVMSWNLYKGGQDAAKKKQALLQQKKLQAQQMELENKIRLQVEEAYYNLKVAHKAVVSTGDNLKSHEQAFFIVSKKYQQGMVPQIEYLKARNDLTGAGIDNIVAIYDYYIKEAQLERISAGGK